MFRRSFLIGSTLAATGGFVRASQGAEQVLHLRLGEDPETLYNVKSISLTVNSTLGSFILDRLVYFDEHEWPKEGYRLLKRVTGCTKADLERS